MSKVKFNRTRTMPTIIIMHGWLLLAVFVQATLSLHACIDAVHVLCVLFPAFMARRLGKARALAAADLYVSLFSVGAIISHVATTAAAAATTPTPPLTAAVNTTPREQPSQPQLQLRQLEERQQQLLRRVLAYWVAAMSLTRLIAAVYTDSAGTLVAAAVMYLLEALSFEFEGTTTCTVPHRPARIVSVVSLSLCIATLFLAVR